MTFRVRILCFAFPILAVGQLTMPAHADLVLHFDMEEGESPLVDKVSGLTAEAVDVGHVYGVTGPDGFGNAVALDDNGAWRLDVDESTLFREFANDFTVSVWVYMDSDTQDYKTDLGEANGTLNRFFGDDNEWDADGWGMGFWQDGRVRFTKNGIIDMDTSGGWVFPDEWTHLAATVSSDDGVTIYVNGEEAQNFPDTRDLNNGLGNNGVEDVYAIGRTYDYTQGQWVGGAMDDLRVYDSVLTPEEVAALLVPGDGGQPGDFNGDGLLTGVDIDLLSAAVASGANDPAFDLTGDNAVDQQDRVVWVEQLKSTYFGDSNLDGEFSSADFVAVFQAGEYEDGTAKNSTWATGDWNGDADFDSSDFVQAFQAGGYELGPRAAVSAVPEPGTWALICLGAVSLAIRRRRSA